MGVQTPETLANLTGEVQQYFNTSKEYVRLMVFKLTMLVVTAMGKSILVGGLLVLALLFLSFAFSWILGEWLRDGALGFLIVGALYLVFALLAYWKREKLHAPVLRYFSRKFFES